MNHSSSPEVIILGPDAIEPIAQAVHELSPYLKPQNLRFLASGGLEFTSSDSAEAGRKLRAVVENALPRKTCDALGSQSGLGWNGFFSHVLAYWLANQKRIGFLRALADRAAIHHLDLQMHWNQGRQVPVIISKWDLTPMIWGGIFGIVAAVILAHFWHRQPLLYVCAVALGIVIGRIYIRIAVKRRCGDPLCQAPLTARDHICPSCGATITNPMR